MSLNPHALLLTALLPKHDRVTTAHVPLQTPSPGFRFLNTIIGHPTFSFNFESGNPEQLIELRYSTGYRSSPSPLSPLFLIESALRNSLSSPGNCWSNASLISSTSSFRLVRIVR